MLIRAYTVYDNKALVYAPPFFAATDGAAVRMFQDVANDLNTSIGQHPGDFSLWWCGMYDDQKGIFQPNVPLAHVIDAAALVKAQAVLPLQPVGRHRDTEGDRDVLTLKSAHGDIPEAAIPQDFLKTGGR